MSARQETGWLNLVGQRGRIFAILVVSLLIDSAFLLIWLGIHAVFEFSSWRIGRWLEAVVTPGHPTSPQPFNTIFFATGTLLDLAAAAIIGCFVFEDLKETWRKINPSR